MTKLNQIIAIEKGVKARTNASATEVYHTFQRDGSFNGVNRTYEPIEDGGMVYPPESTRVQNRVPELLKQLQAAYQEFFNVTAQKDFANTTARANVVVDGTTLVENAPVPFLLFLEKQLTDMKTALSKAPVLSPNEEWVWDGEQGIYRAAPSQTTKTKKTQRPVVLHPATKEHPAQTTMVTEDVVEGHWNTTKLSGAMSATRRTEILSRMDALLTAVKFAREQANMADAPKVQVGEALTSFIFG